MMKRDVLTKEDMYERWMAMEFGNRPRAWGSYVDWVCDEYDGPVALRYCEPNSDRKAYGVDRLNVTGTMWRLGGEKSKYRISEQSNLGDVAIQGELTVDEHGVFLAYSHEQLPMGRLRNRLLEARGSAALTIIDRHLDSCDAQDLRDLLASYPGHVIEFGSYHRPMGVCHRRMCVWEVRKY